MQKTLSLLLVIIFVGIMPISAVPQTTELLEQFQLLTTGNDPAHVGQTSPKLLEKPLQLQVSGNGTTLEVSGFISIGTTDQVKEYFALYPEIKIIDLNSDGGRVSASRRLAAFIEKRNLFTFTTRGCLSACIIPYAAGKERYIGKEAVLGFHQYDFPISEYDTDREYLLSKGINSKFVGKIFETHHSDMWKPSHEELIESGFVTMYSNDIDVTTVISNLEEYEQLMSKTPLFVAIKEANPDGYNQIVAGYKKVVEQGQSPLEFRKIVFPIAFHTVHQRLPHTSGEALLEFAQVMVDQYKHYSLINHKLCIDIPQASDAEAFQYIAGLFPDMPLDLVTKEMHVSARVINEYSQFNEIPEAEDVVDNLVAVYADIIKIHGEKAAYLIFSGEINSAKDQSIYCSVTASLYEEIMKLPPREAVKALRFTFGHLIRYRRAFESGQNLSEEARKVQAPIAYQILFERLPYTSDEALLEYTKYSINELKHFRLISPQQCYDYAHSADVSVPPFLPQHLLDEGFEASKKVVKEYSKFNEVPSTDDVMNLMEEIYANIEQFHGDQAGLILENSDLVSLDVRRARFCSISISVFQEILKLPPRDAVKMLRYLFV